MRMTWLQIFLRTVYGTLLLFLLFDVKLVLAGDLDPGQKELLELYPMLAKMQKDLNGGAKFNGLNFGVVARNSHHQIYRSHSLGARGARDLFSMLQSQDFGIPNLVISMNKQGYRMPEGCPAQFCTEEDHYFSCDYNYAESLIFSSSGEYPGVAFFHPLNSDVYMHGKDLDDESGCYPLLSFADSEVIQFYQEEGFSQAFEEFLTVKKVNFYLILERILSSKSPVLFHCSSGRHRTGMIALALRTIQGGDWTAELENPLTINTKQEATSFELRTLAEIEYYYYNLRGFRSSNIESIRKLSQENRFVDLIRKYRSSLVALP